MPATMFITIRRQGSDGRWRPHYITVPWVSALLEPEPGERPRYFVDQDEPPPIRPMPGAQPSPPGAPACRA